MSLEGVAKNRIKEQHHRLSKRFFDSRKRIEHQNNYVVKIIYENIKELVKYYKNELKGKTKKQAEEILFEKTYSLIKQLKEDYHDGPGIRVVKVRNPIDLKKQNIFEKLEWVRLDESSENSGTLFVTDKGREIVKDYNSY